MNCLCVIFISYFKVQKFLRCAFAKFKLSYFFCPYVRKRVGKKSSIVVTLRLRLCKVFYSTWDNDSCKYLMVSWNWLRSLLNLFPQWGIKFYEITIIFGLQQKGNYILERNRSNQFYFEKGHSIILSPKMAQDKDLFIKLESMTVKVFAKGVETIKLLSWKKQKVLLYQNALSMCPLYLSHAQSVWCLQIWRIQAVGNTRGSLKWIPWHYLRNPG